VLEASEDEDVLIVVEEEEGEDDDDDEVRRLPSPPSPPSRLGSSSRVRAHFNRIISPHHLLAPRQVLPATPSPPGSPLHPILPLPRPQTTDSTKRRVEDSDENEQEADEEVSVQLRKGLRKKIKHSGTVKVSVSSPFPRDVSRAKTDC